MILDLSTEDEDGGEEWCEEDFLRLDTDLLEVAARASAPATVKRRPRRRCAAWCGRCPRRTKDEVLLRLLRGQDTQLRAELLRRFDQPADEMIGGRRSAGALLAAAQESRTRRQRQAQQREAAERQRREQAAAAARQQRLDDLAAGQDDAWRQVAALITTKRPKEYDAALTLLGDLKALSERDGGTAAFTRRVRRLRDEHARKPSLLDRLDRAGLG